ncbi:helix-turn-helix domain-containing protein, partial [Mesorhizobium japonicum]|uniref:helix-turn-helix domain-containing protein n=1 Tax=Mesorhizobium japonicum TaxID=2066070 RepID=UPI003B5AA7FD
MGSAGLAPSESHLARVALGITIRNLRKRRGLSQTELGLRVFLSQPEISRLERAKHDDLKPELIDVIADALHALPEERDALKFQYALIGLPPDSYRVIFAASAVEKQRRIRAYESIAYNVLQFETAIFPGLLQVPDYMRGVMLAYGVPSEQVEDTALEREARQRILSKSDRKFHFVLSEVVLYTLVAGVEVQLEQLETLITLMSRRNLSVGIIPVSRGTIPLAATSFTMYDGSFAAVETIISEQEITEPVDLRTLEKLHEDLAGLALYGSQAVAVVKKAISSLEARLERNRYE